MANTENIEAKLCAYIDGELDEQGRAEIEKHLTANPQHRGLIEELSRQRELLRALPREAAPEEIMEALQGQLERAGLLGDDDSGQAEVAAMRINRWPQVMAAAAIVLLAIGLVGIIYFILPQQVGDDTYAVGTMRGETSDDVRASTAESTEAETTRVIGGVPAESFARRDVAEKRDDAMAAAPALSEPPAAAAPTAAPTPTEVAAAVAPTLSDDPFVARPGKAAEVAMTTGLGAEVKSVQERLFSADLTRQLQNKPGGLQQNAMVMFVCTADPGAANGEVTNYLVSNGIQWEDVPEGPPAPLDPSATREMHMSKNAPARIESKSMTLRQATQSPDVSIEQTVTLPPVQPEQGQKDQALARTQLPAQTRAGSYAPQAGAQQQQQAEAPLTTQPAQPTDNLIQQRAGEGQFIANNDARRQRMIIARNMTQKQTADLTDSLLKQTYVQRASVYPTALTPAAPAVSSESSVATGSAGATTEPLTLELMQQRKQEADVLARDRGVEVPATQELAAVDAAKDKKEATTAPRSYAGAAALPATVETSAATLSDADAAPATAPAADLAGVGAGLAATQPIPPVDDQQRVDVVIVVQEDEQLDPAAMPNTDVNAASAPAPAPETQPSEPPAAGPEQGLQLPATQPPVVDSPPPQP